MKTYKLIILLISFIYVNSDYKIKKCENNSPNSVEDCKSQNSKEEIEKNNYCCYIKYKILEKEIVSCKPFSIDEMNSIVEYTNSKKDENDGLRILQLECESSYLQIVLFCLILLLL